MSICGEDVTGMFQPTNDVTKHVVDMTASNNRAHWMASLYEEAELSGNCVRSSVTAGCDLNHIATLPRANFAKTSWQSLTLQVTIASYTFHTDNILPGFGLEVLM